MKITKRQLRKIIKEATPSDMYGSGPLGDLEGLVKQVLAIFSSMEPGPDRNAEIYMLIDELEDLASRG
tara:strand:- start:3472 stop:3675 length:204 start_codon:yes stop_codon:yes gene_type:complete